MEVRPAFCQTISASTKATSRLQAVDESKPLCRARPLQLRLREAACTGELRHQSDLEGIGIAAGLSRGGEDEHVGAIGQAEVEAADIGRELLAADQRVVQARRASAADDVAEERHDWRTTVFRWRYSVTDVDRRRRRLRIGDNVALLMPHVLRHTHVGERRNPRPARNRTEIFAHHLLHLRHIDVASDNQHCVVGRVVGLEEARDVGEAGGGEIRHRPDHRVMVGVALGEERFSHLLWPRAVGLVVE